MPSYYVTTTVDLGSHSINVEIRINADNPPDAGTKSIEIATARFLRTFQAELITTTTKSVVTVTRSRE